MRWQEFSHRMIRRKRPARDLANGAYKRSFFSSRIDNHVTRKD